MKKPLPEGTRIYYGTLALAAGDESTGLKVLGGIKGDRPEIAQLRDVAMAQREVLAGKPGSAVSRLAESLDGMTPSNRPLGTYWLGMAKLGSGEVETRRQGVLRLLHLPALYGKTAPELAAAALYLCLTLLSNVFFRWVEARYRRGQAMA